MKQILDEKQGLATGQPEIEVDDSLSAETRQFATVSAIQVRARPDDSASGPAFFQVNGYRTQPDRVGAMACFL